MIKKKKKKKSADSAAEAAPADPFEPMFDQPEYSHQKYTIILNRCLIRPSSTVNHKGGSKRSLTKKCAKLS